jgi:hypothetical protein
VSPRAPASRIATRFCLDEADKTAALRHARIVTASDTDDATALAVAAFVTNMLSKEQGAALTAIERALALNPACATPSEIVLDCDK